MKKTATKRALLLSALSVLLCVSMLIGTTYAWFTDEVTSTGNIIKSGNLDVEMYWADGAEAVPAEDSEAWTDASAGSIFNYDKWEPGYTVARHIKISNVGTLALKYVVNVLARDGENKLAEVIDVYFVDPAVQVAGRTALTDEFKVGTLADVLAGTAGSTEGDLVAGASDYVTIALKMQEEAGNEYKNLSIGAESFTVQLLATQLTYEEDSFDDQYDAEAVYPVANIEDFQAALEESEDGDIIQFVKDFAGDVTLPQKKDTKITIDGNNQNFAGTLLVDGKSATQTTAGVTIKNVNFTTATADACIQLGKDNLTRYTCNVTIEDCTFDAPGAVGVKSYTGGDKNVVIRDCTATANAHSLAQLKGVDGVLIENCTVNSKNGINLNNSDNVTISGCTVDVQGYAVRFGESSGGSGAAETYTIENCTLKSANDDGDATIILRGTADYATLTIVNTTITGTPDITNTATGATVVR